MQNRTWYLVSVGNLTAVPGSNATTLFGSNGQSISGSTGCNELGGAYKVEPGNRLTISGFSSTRAACPTEDLNKQEEALLSGSAVQYTYNTPGAYTVQLAVTDQAGQTNTTTRTVQISPVVEVIPPTAVIEGPATAFVGEPVTFSAANSQQGTGVISSYQWQSGDGNNSGAGPDSSFTTICAQPGTYYPTVTIADANGLSDSASTTIVINAQLVGTTWSLSNAIPGTVISLEFLNGTLAGFAGCNNYNANYTTTLAGGNTNNINVGPITSTGSFCTEEMMNQEQAFLESLQTASSYTINGSTLTLTTTSGALIFTAAIPTTFTTTSPS